MVEIFLLYGFGERRSSGRKAAVVIAAGVKPGGFKICR